MTANSQQLGLDGADDFAEGEFPEDERAKERRTQKDYSDDFKDFAGDEINWTSMEKGTLPLNMEWQQSAQSRWDFYFDLAAEAMCMGLGEHQSGLNLRSAVHTFFNTDDPKHVESIDPMYKSIPFLIVRHHGQYYGFFLDSPARQRWDLDSPLKGAHTSSCFRDAAGSCTVSDLLLCLISSALTAF